MTLWKTLRAIFLVLGLIFLMYFWNTRASVVSPSQKEFEKKIEQLKNTDFKTKIYVDNNFYGTYSQKDGKFRLDFPGETTIVIGDDRKNKIAIIDSNKKKVYEGTLEEEFIEKYLSWQGMKVVPFAVFSELKNYKWIKIDSKLWQGRLLRLEALVKFDDSNRFLTHVEFSVAGAPARVSARPVVEKIEYQSFKLRKIEDNAFQVPHGFQKESLTVLKGE